MPSERHEERMLTRGLEAADLLSELREIEQVRDK